MRRFRYLGRVERFRFFILSAVAASGFLFAGLLAGGMKMTENGRPASPSERRTTTIGMGLAGLGLGVAAAASFYSMMNRSVVLDGDEIYEVGPFGKVKPRIKLTSITSVKEEEPTLDTKRFLVIAGDAKLSFSNRIFGYPYLKRVLTKRKIDVPLVPIAPEMLLGIVPEKVVYGYRYCYMHLAGMLEICIFCLFGMVALALPDLSGADHVLSRAVCASLVAQGIYFTLVGYFDRIELGPDGIRWFDWRNRLQIEASLSEIYAVRRPLAQPAFDVETENGIISYVRTIDNQKDLTAKLTALADERRRIDGSC